MSSPGLPQTRLFRNLLGRLSGEHHPREKDRGERVRGRKGNLESWLIFKGYLDNLKNGPYGMVSCKSCKRHAWMKEFLTKLK